MKTTVRDRDSSTELVGVWQLMSFHDLDDDGARQEGPLGPEPTGLLFYAADGHVSVTMMRTRPAGTASERHEQAQQQYLSYAGTWRRDGDQVVHRITLAPDPSWVGLDQVRDLVQDGDRLELRGRGPSGAPQRRVLQWRRRLSS